MKGVNNKRAAVWLAFLCLSCQLAGKDPAGFSQKEGNTHVVIAGAATVPCLPPWQTSLAGYGVRWGSPMEGVLDIPKVRAVYWGGKEQGVILVSADLLLIPAELREIVRRRLPQSLQNFMLVATHTHGGPGNFYRNMIGQAAAAGAFREKVLFFLADRMALAIRRARQIAKPAQFGWTRLSLSTWHSHRRDSSMATDGDAFFLRWQGRDGRTIASAVSFAAHPTVIPPEKKLMNTDFVGFLCRKLEKETGAPSLFLNAGAAQLGPVSRSSSPWQSAKIMGEGMAAEVLQSRARLHPQSFHRWAFRETKFSLPRAELHPSAFRPLGSFFSPFLPQVVPGRTSMRALRAGPVWLVGFPCDLGMNLARVVKSRASQVVVPVSYADDYVGYAVDEKTYNTDWYEAKMSFYGEELGALFVEQALRLCR